MSFLTPDPTPCEVAGRTINFYPVSVRMAFKLKDIGKPLAKAVQALMFTRRDQDVKQDSEEYVNDQTGDFVKKHSVAPLTTELAEYRDKQKGESLDALVETLFADPSRDIIARLMIDSLRDEYEPAYRKNPPGPDVDTFFDDIDIAALRPMVLALAKANSKVFGAPGEKILAAVRKHAEAVSAAPRLVADEEPTKSSPEEGITG
ncbi:MAG TPA: hypothetical protein VM285_11620 [Polyangia bacterium]|nr:hypothetical protein [Polyangia bacterium]